MKLPKPVRVIVELCWLALFTAAIIQILNRPSPLSWFDIACVAVMLAAVASSAFDVVKHFRGRA